MSWNQQIGKKLNKELIVQQFFLKSHLSRSEIIENTNLKKATVANLVNELLEEQLIVEAGKEQSTGGRRSNLLTINEHAGFALSIDIGVNYLTGIMTNLNGTIIWEIKEIIDDTRLDSYFPKIISVIKELEKHVPNSPYHIVGLGIAVPGILDTNGIILNAPNLQWRNVDLVALLEPYISYPAIISNEANAGAFAEFAYSYKQQYQNLLFVSIGYGIGVGIVINGELFLGEQGFSGESGHTIIQMDGKKCRCGNNGCWEAYASEFAFLQEVQHQLPHEHITLENFSQADFDTKVLDPIFSKLSQSIGVGLLNLIYTLNPTKIIIGNRITLLQEHIEDKIKQYVSAKSSSFLQNDISIEFSTLKEHAIPIGGASLAIYQFLLPTLMDSKRKVIKMEADS